MKYGNLAFLEPSGHLGPIMGLIYLYCLPFILGLGIVLTQYARPYAYMRGEVASVCDERLIPDKINFLYTAILRGLFLF